MVIHCVSVPTRELAGCWEALCAVLVRGGGVFAEYLYSVAKITQSGSKSTERGWVSGCLYSLRKFRVDSSALKNI